MDELLRFFQDKVGYFDSIAKLYRYSGQWPSAYKQVIIDGLSSLKVSSRIWEQCSDMTNSTSPDDKTVRLLAVPAKLAAAACISLSVGGVLSCLAKVPIYANGVAI